MISWKTVKAAVVVIFTGWLASATWDFVGKPVLAFIGEALLVVGTYAFESTRESVYAQISQVSPLGTAASASVGVLYLMLMALMFVGAKNIVQSRRIIEENSGLSSTRKTISTKVNYYKIELMAFKICLAISVLLTMFVTSRTSYVVDLRNGLERYQVLVSPYISEAERLQFASRTVSINSKADYLSLNKDLEEIVQKNGLRKNPARFIL